MKVKFTATIEANPREITFSSSYRGFELSGRNCTPKQTEQRARRIQTHSVL